MSAAVVVLTTAPNAAEAETLARKIVEARLAACAQVLPPMKSFYFWQNRIQTDSEHLLLIKTLAEKFDELEKYIQANHSYDVPEIVALSAERVSESYLGFLSAECGVRNRRQPAFHSAFRTPHSALLFVKSAAFHDKINRVFRRIGQVH